MAIPAEPARPDGRRVRRERNRTAVIDAMFDLLAEGHFPPSVDDVAARSGVSVSSVFRYFDGLDDLQEQTIERYLERFSPLLGLPDGEGRALEERIGSFVGARLDLYETTAPIARMARHRAREHPRVARSLHEIRSAFADQIRVHFRPELEARDRPDARDRVALIDVMTAFEAWDLLTTVHGRSRRLVERAWTTGIASLLD